MSGLLDEILVRTRADLAERRRRVPERQLRALAEERPRRAPGTFAHALRRGAAARGIACIAEHKRRSPSAGWIRKGSDVAAVARAYAGAGAAALSILTEGPHFGGSLDDLIAARAAVDLPLLRKDFVVDPYQVVEAAAAGADAVLLIAAALPDAALRDLLTDAVGQGLDALVECHDEAEVERALAAGAWVIGINHRNLNTLVVDTTLATRLRPGIPADRVVVAESGLRTPADVARMRAGAIQSILVGESLMRAADPGAALAELLKT